MCSARETAFSTMTPFHNSIIISGFNLLSLAFRLHVGVMIVLTKLFLGLANQFVDVALDLVDELTHSGLHLLGIIRSR